MAPLRSQAERDAAARAARIVELTVGGVVDDVISVLLQAEADGIPYGEAQAFLDDYLQGRWGDEASPILRTIFRTNVQTAFNALRFERMAGDATRPVWRFVAVEDERTSDTCNACDGVTLASDDLWWATHWPPLHHNCRSTVVPLSEGALTDRPPLTAATAAEGFGLLPDLSGQTLEID